MELTEETAKIYGDAFARAGIRYQFKDINLNMTGADYINEFENNKMELNPNIGNYNNYTSSPLEIEDKKTVLDKIFFKGIKERRNQKYLPSNINSSKDIKQEFLDRINYSNYQYPDLDRIKEQGKSRSEYENEK